MRKVTITEVDLENGKAKLSIDTEGLNTLEVLGVLQLATQSYMATDIDMRHVEESDPPCQT